MCNVKDSAKREDPRYMHFVYRKRLGGDQEVMSRNPSGPMGPTRVPRK